MLMINLFVSFIILVFYLNDLRTLTLTLRKANTFMHYLIDENDYTHEIVKVYKRYVLKMTRLFSLCSYPLLLVFVLLNQSYLFAIIFLVIMIGLLIYVNHKVINKSYLKLQSLNLISDVQDTHYLKYGILYKGEDAPLFKCYGVRRYILNIQHSLFKPLAIVTTLVIAIIMGISFNHDLPSPLVDEVSYEYGQYHPIEEVLYYIDTPYIVKDIVEEEVVHTQEFNEEISYQIEGNRLFFRYQDREYSIRTDRVRYLDILDRLPVINSNIDAYQNNGVTIGNMYLQGLNKAFFFIDRRATPIIRVQLRNDNVYFFNKVSPEIIEILRP